MIGRALCGLALLASAGCASIAPRATPAPLDMALWRLDCGLFDIDDLEGKGRVRMPVSCYLIRHGTDLVLFDAGLSAGLIGKPERQEGQTLSLARTLAAQLNEIGIDPAKIETLIVSHYHGDHHGQADNVPNARLLIGAGDLAAFRAAPPRERTINPWLDGRRRVEPVVADRDLFGDGRVRVLFTPGHTPGHLSLLVKLPGGAYVLTGDLVHDREQLATLEPSGNHTDKAQGKVEIERVLALAEAEGAVIVVGHDQRDNDKLPAFPVAAR